MATALVDLDSVGTTRSWAYDEATLLEPGRYTARSPMTSATFAKVFYRTFPALATMKWDNVCVRGGSVVDLMLGAEPADLDLCFYGLPDAAAVLARAADVVRFLLDAERAVVEAINTARASSRSGHSGGARAVFPYGSRGELDLAYVSEAQRVDIKAVRTGPVVTLRAGAVRVPVQLVLCGYPSLAAAARGADMAVCGALFTGERVLMDADARWSLENMAVRVPTGRFPSVARLEKYFNKGFDVVLPGLDATKIPQGYLPLGLVDAVATPGGLRFSYKAVEGNKISLAAFLPPPAPPSFSVFAEADYVGDVLNSWPGLTPRQVENTYAGVEAAAWNEKAGGLSFTNYEKYVTAVPLRALLADIAAAPPGESLEDAARRAVKAAVVAQKAASNAALPALAALYEGRPAPVLEPAAAFPHQTRGDADVFYGVYKKTE